MSAKLGIQTIDIGAPQLSMHSIREMGDTTSIVQCTDLFKVRLTAWTRAGVVLANASLHSTYASSVMYFYSFSAKDHTHILSI
jgi:hypothetical protein